MNRVQKVLARWLGLKAVDEAAISRAFTLQDHDMLKRFGAATYTGKAVTEQSALQVSTAWACVRIITETIGALPLSLYERDAAGNAHKVEHDISPVLITSPNAEMTGVEFRETIPAGLALRGNAFNFIERGAGGNLISLFPIPPDKITPKRAEDGTRYYNFNDRGRIERVPAEKVWHIKGFGTDGLMGLSPIGYARQALGVALASEEFQARFFASGANPSYLISIPQWLEKDQREIARENINKLWSGPDNIHRAQLLEGGMTATAATMPLQDAQFMELRGFGIQEICRIYRIPPHMVADLSRSTNNNIEHQGTEFVTFTLTPYLTRIEASVARWLLRPEERSKYFLRFNGDALMRADAAGRAALYSSGLQNGWLSRNEVRALENRNRVDGLDGYTAQTNLAAVDRVMAGDTLKLGNTAAPAKMQEAPLSVQLPQLPEEKRVVTVKLPDELRKLFGLEGEALDDLAITKIMSRISALQTQHTVLAGQLRTALESVTAMVAGTASEHEKDVAMLSAALESVQATQRKHREIAYRELGLNDDGTTRVSH